MKKFFSGLALLTAVIALASCEDDIFGWGNGSHRTYGENEIVFSIGESNSGSTRAEASHTVVAPSHVIDLPCEENTPQLVLTETVTSMDEEFFDAVSGTRGTPVYTENFDYLYGSDLYVTAFDAAIATTVTTQTEGQEYKMPSETWGSYLENNGTVPYKKVADEPNTYSYDYSKGQSVNLAWPDSEKLWLFLEAPYSETKNLDRKFTHEGWITFDYASPTTAQAQKDILFTSKQITKTANDAVNSGKSDPHKILLYHALSGVKFKIGNMEALPEGTTIEFTDVEFQSLYSEGNCIIKPDYEGYSPASNAKPSATKPKSAVCTTWAGQKTAETFKLDCNSTIDYKDRNMNIKYPDSFWKTTSGKNDVINDNNINNADYSNTFLFIPQPISKTGCAGGTTTQLNVDYKITQNGTSHEYSVTVALPEADWKAGELRTYTLDCLTVHVRITDDMNDAGTVKSNLQTTNTGTGPEYQRVYLSANWIYTDETYGDVIVKPQPIVTIQADGTVTTNTTGFTVFPGEGWVLGDDGFFYYTNPIQAGATPNVPLFEKFTNPYTTAETIPYPDSHLEMTVTVQAVKFNEDKRSVTEIWGMTKSTGTKAVSGDKDYIFNKLSTTIETPTSQDTQK